jgi:hypothetical protein
MKSLWGHWLPAAVPFCSVKNNSQTSHELGRSLIQFEHERSNGRYRAARKGLDRQPTTFSELLQAVDQYCPVEINDAKVGRIMLAIVDPGLGIHQCVCGGLGVKGPARLDYLAWRIHLDDEYMRISDHNLIPQCCLCTKPLGRAKTRRRRDGPATCGVSRRGVGRHGKTRISGEIAQLKEATTGPFNPSNVSARPPRTARFQARALRCRRSQRPLGNRYRT